MKKFLSILTLCLITLISNAQIYTSIKYLDKFDDIVKEQNVKTIVEKTDSTFVVETKDKNPVTYYILNVLEANCAGDKNNIVNLVANVYGYQTCWCVVRSDMIDEYRTAHDHVFWRALEIATNDELDVEEKLQQQNNEFSKLDKYYLFIIHRIITTQYTHEYKSEYFWIQDEMNTKLGKDINRIVYIKN